MTLYGPAYLVILTMLYKDLYMYVFCLISMLYNVGI